MRAALAGRGILLYFASDPRTLWPLRLPLPVWLDVGVDSIPARWGPVCILGGSRVPAVGGVFRAHRPGSSRSRGGLWGAVSRRLRRLWDCGPGMAVLRVFFPKRTFAPN